MLLTQVTKVVGGKRICFQPFGEKSKLTKDKKTKDERKETFTNSQHWKSVLKVQDLNFRLGVSDDIWLALNPNTGDVKGEFILSKNEGYIVYDSKDSKTKDEEKLEYGDRIQINSGSHAGKVGIFIKYLSVGSQAEVQIDGSSVKIQLSDVVKDSKVKDDSKAEIMDEIKAVREDIAECKKEGRNYQDLLLVLQDLEKEWQIAKDSKTRDEVFEEDYKGVKIYSEPSYAGDRKFYFKSKNGDLISCNSIEDLKKKIDGYTKDKNMKDVEPKSEIAFEEGKKANIAKKSINDNPYKGTRQERDWEDGYRYATKDGSTSWKVLYIKNGVEESAIFDDPESARAFEKKIRDEGGVASIKVPEFHKDCKPSYKDKALKALDSLKKRGK